MAKYIDAERLKAEIERRFWDYGTPLHDDVITAKVDEVLALIDSLQQEQPEVDLEKFTTRAVTMDMRRQRKTSSPSSNPVSLRLWAMRNQNQH